MAEYFFSAKREDGSTLCIAPLSNRRIELSGEDLDDVSGYFLYATRGGEESVEVEIIARLTSEEAALELKRMLDLN